MIGTFINFFYTSFFFFQFHGASPNTLVWCCGACGSVASTGLSVACATLDEGYTKTILLCKLQYADLPSMHSLSVRTQYAFKWSYTWRKVIQMTGLHFRFGSYHMFPSISWEIYQLQFLVVAFSTNHKSPSHCKNDILLCRKPLIKPGEQQRKLLSFTAKLLKAAQYSNGTSLPWFLNTFFRCCPPMLPNYKIKGNTLTFLHFSPKAHKSK